MYPHRWRSMPLLVYTWCMTLSTVSAGYLSLNVTPATQCGVSTVQWWGDEGPYHLLLTPTTFKQHGYNVWIPSIDGNLNKYDIPINQPEGLQFLVTMWGASGIEMAGTTDVLSVGPPTRTTGNTTSCFLSDNDILGLYTFSFNMSDPTNGYPPQCANLSMSWPTNLESNVTGGGMVNAKRSTSDLPNSTNVDSTIGDFSKSSQWIDEEPQFNQLDTSSSSEKHSGNTTNPPTIFGIIPLGNSFSIPISYANGTKLASRLPASSISNTPTTWTGQGVTHLNWMVNMARGTRFILVAGIGSNQQWASGGSSQMMTVGQGGTECVGSEQGGDGAPSVTATSTSTATSAPDNDISKNGTGSTLVKTIVACVLSVLATLALVGVLYYLRRLRNRRRIAAAASASSHEIYKGGSIKKKLRRSAAAAYDPRSREEDGSTDTQLDLISSRDSSRGVLPPIVTRVRGRPGDAHAATSPISDPFDDSPIGSAPISGRPLLPPSRATTFDSAYTASPISPRQSRELTRGESINRHTSQDALLNLASYTYDTPPPPLPGVAGGIGGLRLHGGDGSARYTDEEDDAQGDLSDMKRDTLAYLGAQPGSSTPAATRGGGGGGDPSRRAATATPGTGRWGRQGDRPEYVVHRDAGRVPNTSNARPGRVLELPPRYEELEWDEEDPDARARQTR